MTDKEILEEVYRMLSDVRTNYVPNRTLFHNTVEFIEQEWQKRDDKDAKVAADEMIEATTFSKGWYNKNKKL
jgi:hypothetical protein